MLCYISSLGMMIFILVAALLLHGNDTLSDSTNFLNPTTSSPSSSAEDGNGDGKEIYLFIMILCYIAFSSLGVNILPWTLITELFQIEVIFFWKENFEILQGRDTSNFYHCLPVFVTEKSDKNWKCPSLEFLKFKIKFCNLTSLKHYFFLLF